MNDKALLINLPSEITTNILSRLPIKTITSCKCVCRKWLELLSSAEFAKFHLSRSSTPGLVVYQVDMDQSSSCKVVEFEDVLELQHHDLHYNPLLQFDPKTFINAPNAIWMKGSVNGLLCWYHMDDSQFLDALYICNPITREYITLPTLKGKLHYPNVATYGFGVSSSSGLYKLVRINHGPIENGPGFKVPDFDCQIYTIGTTGSWRSIELSQAPCQYTNSSDGVSLNGNLHWVAVDEKDRQLVSCFDLETELFNQFSLPPLSESFTFPVSLGVLWDCLCLCDSSDDDEIVIWVMKDYGDEKSWTKEFVIGKEAGDLGGLTYEAVYPLKVFKDGEILLLWEGTRLFYYSNKTEDAPEVDLFKVNHPGRVQAMLHTSSFLPLKSFAMENIASF